MVITEFHNNFKNIFYKIKDELIKTKIKKQIKKIIENPEVGKPMMYNRKGTRELYIKPFRLSYAYVKEENKIIFLDLYHKDEQ
jgi:mRNA-degrading endonuclease RelE of RelBE toxin-antitoxin system